MKRYLPVPALRAPVRGVRWIVSSALLSLAMQTAHAQDDPPALVDPDLEVSTVISGLEGPISMAFLKKNDFFILEKGTGKVKRVENGAVTSTPLDLPVNSASERGLLGIALHPRFPQNPGVYLYWTESTTGADSDVLSDVALLGNRVDRYRWNGTTLTFDKNLIRLRALQEDAGQDPRGNHDGGVLRFGPDGKLYIYMGDNGRRGQMQNLPDGPGPAGNSPDDQFGGPEPDNAHLTGVILRLNDDGTLPTDNPFYRAGALRGGEVGANLQKVFAYGIRNGFGMAFDPFSGQLWEAQNGDDSFTEINLVDAGSNLGWVQVMGPLSRIDQFKEIETSTDFFGLQQVRWSPENIADSEDDAIDRMFWVFEGGNTFGARLSGRNEVPPVTTDAAASARFTLNRNGSLSYELRATRAIQDVRMAHIHLGGYGQNGPIVAFLFESATPVDFARNALISRGTIRDAGVIARPGFTATVTDLVQRMRQGRTYTNVHTTAFPGGEIRGQNIVTDREPVSQYSDPEFSWKYEVAPAAVGFVKSLDLGRDYFGDMIVGAARDTLQGGHLFRFNLRWERQGDARSRDRSDSRSSRNGGSHGHGRGNGHRLGRTLDLDDPLLRDRVADNLGKFDITESESLLFGTNFGVVTDIQNNPGRGLYLVSLTRGTVYSIERK
ncbi:MAG TPA: PQQ-dependent sugar dehydrogenase [Verrucomicrobiales bacterium]|nr:PQQ-dependent sugar dehydrogenase [Verrucomicrobiales bacterium]